MSADVTWPYGPFVDNVRPIPYELCASLLDVDPVRWPPLEVPITEEMCRRYHLAYIEAGEAAGASIRLEAIAWAELHRAEALEYSIRVRAEADAYRAAIHAEM